MTKEDYVSFEVAKLLKEKGFDEECWSVYDDGILCSVASLDRHYECGYGDLVITSQNSMYDDWENYIAAPTLQIAMKWLREKGIIITITYTMYSLHIIGSQMMFGFKVQNVQGELLLENTEVAYDSYESACEAAIKYSLENLINNQ